MAPPTGVRIAGSEVPGSREILTPEALEFVAGLHRALGARRDELLHRRVERQAEIDAGATLGLLPETAAIRLDPSWRGGEEPPPPPGRGAEDTGPAAPKNKVNPPKPGGRGFIAHFRDA